MLLNDIEQVFLTIMKLNSITSKNTEFAGDCCELEKMKKHIERLEQKKMIQQKLST